MGKTDDVILERSLIIMGFTKGRFLCLKVIWSSSFQVTSDISFQKIYYLREGGNISEGGGETDSRKLGK